MGSTMRWAVRRRRSGLVPFAFLSLDGRPTAGAEPQRVLGPACCEVLCDLEDLAVGESVDVLEDDAGTRVGRPRRPSVVGGVVVLALEGVAAVIVQGHRPQQFGAGVVDASGDQERALGVVVVSEPDPGGVTGLVGVHVQRFVVVEFPAGLHGLEGEGWVRHDIDRDHSMLVDLSPAGPAEVLNKSRPERPFA
jgi:hypothetical protein